MTISGDERVECKQQSSLKWNCKAVQGSVIVTLRALKRDRGRRICCGQSSRTESKRRLTEAPGLSASDAGCLEFSRKVSTSPRRKRLIRPIA